MNLFSGLPYSLLSVCVVPPNGDRLVIELSINLFSRWRSFQAFPIRFGGLLSPPTNDQFPSQVLSALRALFHGSLRTQFNPSLALCLACSGLLSWGEPEAGLAQG